MKVNVNQRSEASRGQRIEAHTWQMHYRESTQSHVLFEDWWGIFSRMKEVNKRLWAVKDEARKDSTKKRALRIPKDTSERLLQSERNERTNVLQIHQREAKVYFRQLPTPRSIHFARFLVTPRLNKTRPLAFCVKLLPSSSVSGGCRLLAGLS
jgi:hypothetical protein